VYDDDVSNENKQSVFDGTIRQDFGRPRPLVNPQAGLGIRASPFEPLIRDRNLPKSGTISPLNTEEYKAWRESRQDESQLNNPLASEQCHRVGDNDENSWKLRYLKSEIARTQTRMNTLALKEEKLQMRIEILGLQAELYLERKQSTIKLPDDVTKMEYPVDCDVSNESETLNFINVTRGSCPWNSVGSSTDSLPDASELDRSANDGLECCVKKATSTLDNEILDLVVKQAEGSTEATALVVSDTVETNQSESHKEQVPSVRMTRSCGQQEDAEIKEKDVTAEISETLAEGTVARVRIDDHDVVTSDNSKMQVSKADDKVETDPVEAVSLLSPGYSVDGMNKCATGKGKCKLNGNVVASFQAPPLKK
jgi:hypothetical protein